MELKQILEALLFITDHPVPVAELAALTNTAEPGTVRQALEELRADYDSRNSALAVTEVAGGYQLSTRESFAPWIKQLYKDKTTFRLSASAMETLSIIAYKQPITRAEIEEIRGVETTAVLDTLMERKLIRHVGRKETLGRPMLYGTTHEFMKYFGIKNLADLPALDKLLEQTAEEPATVSGHQEEEHDA